MALKIGQVAERGGVNLQTIRYYEREKLLPAPPRLQSGYRMFPENTVSRVRFIKRAQDLGFTLAEIKGLLSLRSTTREIALKYERLPKQRLPTSTRRSARSRG